MAYTLRKYQAAILDEVKPLSSFALFMSTGTGKTITSLARVEKNPTSKLLIICPANVKLQWEENIVAHFKHLRVLQFPKYSNAETKNQLLKDKYGLYDVVILNYEIIMRMDNLNWIVDENWTIILDEMHRIKSWGTKKKPILTTRFICSLGQKTDFKIGLTATPTQGNWGGYLDYYPQLLFLGYTDLTYYEFYDKHVKYKMLDFGGKYPIKQVVGYYNINEIEDILKIIAKRYVPEYGEFPPQHNKIFVDRAPNYAKMIREKILKKGDEVIVINKSGRKRVAMKTMTTGTVFGQDMLNEHHAIEDNTIKLDWLRDFLQDTDEPVVIFYAYKIELESLKVLFKSLKKTFLNVTSKTSHLIRDGDYNVYVGQFQAMGTGVDGLHLKSHISIFFSMPESSLHYQQAIGRIDRDGQTKVPMYYYILMKRTIDEDIMTMIEEKVAFSEETLEQLEVKIDESISTIINK